MRILVAGGGPAGLYFAILLKKADPRHEIVVLERNPRGVTFGWGVVFSDETLDNLAAADAVSLKEVTDTFAHWDAIETFIGGRCLRSVGHGFSGISRKRLLDILTRRAESLGVEVRFETEVDAPAQLEGWDLVVAADGINSRIRSWRAADFEPSLENGACRYIWLGTTLPLDAFTFVFEPAAGGWLAAHAYRFDATTSTFIVETDEATHLALGYDSMPIDACIADLERRFAANLKGHRLLQNKSSWLRFVTVKNASWRSGNVVLLGDAAHTAHFSIGSGTKLAMEDVIVLAESLRAHDDVAKALDHYDAERRPQVARTQKVAGDSQRWFEEVRRHAQSDPLTFTFSLLTRSSRITYDNLALRNPELVAEVRAAYAQRAGAKPTTPPMLTPLALRGLTLPNRVVVSPMCMYSAVDGTVNEFHLVHLGSRAMGGAGLVMTEMTDVARDGRISPACAGMYLPEHTEAWKRIVDFVHERSSARIGIQLAHAGRKGSTCVPWEGMDEPLPSDNWPLWSASPIPYGPRSQTPREMDRAAMDDVLARFVRSTGMAVTAGFDLVELHMAHGYLLSSFLSPLTNHRKDAYGGDIGKRMRYPLEVVDAVRAAWPRDRPLSVRISATDWVEGGLSAEDALELARSLSAHGVDLIDVSAGQTTPAAHPPFYGRMFQTRFSDAIRNGAGVKTIAVGNITDADQINTILAAGRADLCALARAHLNDPYFTLHAAAAQGFDDQPWPSQYLAAKPRPAS